jgi:hypothetical protein
MASTKRGKKTAGKRSRAKAPAKAGKSAKKGALHAGRARTKVRRPAKAAARAAGSAKPTRAPGGAARGGTAKRAGTASARGSGAGEIAKLKARFQRERSQLEKRLTETVREIGQLRHHEMRASQLERQLGERDATIGALRKEVETLQAQAARAPVSADAQPSLDFGMHESGDLDDLDEPGLDSDDDDLI